MSGKERIAIAGHVHRSFLSHSQTDLGSQPRLYIYLYNQKIIILMNEFVQPGQIFPLLAGRSQ